jgi:hypothetical protein
VEAVFLGGMAWVCGRVRGIKVREWDAGVQRREQRVNMRAQ